VSVRNRSNFARYSEPSRLEASQRHPYARSAHIVSAALWIGLSLLLLAGSAAAEVPIQDNELVLGVAVGPLAVLERDAPYSADSTLRFGVAAEAFVGLLNRSTPWLHSELLAGVSALWLGDSGFVQQVGTGARQRNALVGLMLRGAFRLTSREGVMSLALGFEADILTAPASGVLTRVLLDAALGTRVFHTPQQQLIVELAYGVPLLNGFSDEPGCESILMDHRLLVRTRFSF